MSNVRVRVWTATQGNTSVAVDVEQIMPAAAAIWAAAGVILEVEKDVHDVALSAVARAPVGSSQPNLEKLVSAELQGVLNPVIQKDRVGWLDVVLVPTFTHWGQSYSPLAVLSPGKQNSFAPFTGPVAIVATFSSLPITAGPEQTRAEASAPLPDAGPGPLLPNIAIANDVAHEIGHVLGLWHTSDVNPNLHPPNAPATRDVHNLMYTTLYSQAAGSSGSADVARKFATSSPPEEAARLHVGKSGTWYILLRGEAIDEPNRTLACHNIDSELVWPSH